MPVAHRCASLWLCCALAIGCGAGDSDPEPADYPRAFPQDRVGRLDLTIASSDWDRMRSNLTEMLGAFGSGSGLPGGPGGGFPPELQQACVGKAAGDSCSATVAGAVIDGTCGDVQGTLTCVPAGGGPGGGSVGTNEDPIYVPCTVAADGETWQHVGVRFKGNSSLSSTWSAGINKLPLRLKFDEFQDQFPDTDKQRFFGFRSLSLSNGWSDASLVRDKLGTDVFAEAGFAVPATAFYQVYIDHGEGPKYFGLYTAIEIPSDKAFLRTHWGDSDGNLYKPELSGIQGGGSFATYDTAAFGKQNHKETADFTDVKALYDALHADRADAAAWRIGLERWLDVDGFLRWLAYNSVIQDWDTYGLMGHNYYLYGVPSDQGRMQWIPWDHTFAFSATGFGAGRQPLSLAMTEVTAQWPLIRFLLDDASYRASYDRYVAEVISTVYEPGRAQSRFATARARIEPYVVGSGGEQPGYTHLSSPSAFAAAHDELQQHPGQRARAVATYLAL